MADRPLGAEPSFKREFEVKGSLSVEPIYKPSVREKASELIHHVRHFSFNRGSILELELEDDMIDFLKRAGWIRSYRGRFFFTRRGSRALVETASELIEQYKTDK